MSKIYLHNVGISYPSIINRPFYEGQYRKYRATLLIPKSDTATKAKLDTAIKEALIIADLKDEKGISYKMVDYLSCLKDGNITGQGHHHYGNWTLIGSNDEKPIVTTIDGESIINEGVIYPGCRVNAIVDIYAKKNEFGKFIIATLKSVQLLENSKINVKG